MVKSDCRRYSKARSCYVHGNDITSISMMCGLVPINGSMVLVLVNCGQAVSAGPSTQ